MKLRICIATFLFSTSAMANDCKKINELFDQVKVGDVLITEASLSQEEINKKIAINNRKIEELVQALGNPNKKPYYNERSFKSKQAKHRKMVQQRAGQMGVATLMGSVEQISNYRTIHCRDLSAMKIYKIDRSELLKMNECASFGSVDYVSLECSEKLFSNKGAALYTSSKQPYQGQPIRYEDDSTGGAYGEPVKKETVN